jgi:quinol monooxygenase YgiN
VTLVAIADLFGIAGRRDDLLALLGAAQRDAAAQPGCLRYTYAAALGEPDRFVLVGEWRDEASMNAHYSSRTFAEFQFALDGLLARPTEMTIHTVSASTRPIASGPMDPRDAD